MVPGAGLEKALEIAFQAHKGQKDRYGSPYILHPLRMMMRMDTEEEMIAAVLHDVVEKSRFSLDDLRESGFPAEIIRVVDDMTKREGELYSRHIDRTSSHPMSRKIKLADIEDNIDPLRMRQPRAEDWKRLDRFLQAWLILKKPAGSEDPHQTEAQ